MSTTFTRRRVAVAIAAIALLTPTAAAATHIFDDVDDGRFYAVAVEWAFENGITTGKSSSSFAPDDGVTRGESVTFLQRYDTEIVQPAIADLEESVDGLLADENADTVDDYHAADLTRVAHLFDAASVSEWNSGTDRIDLLVTAPVDGAFFVTATTTLGRDAAEETASGYGTLTNNLEIGGANVNSEPFSHEVNFEVSLEESPTHTWVVPVAAGDHTITSVWNGATSTRVVLIYNRSLTALFVPFGNDGSPYGSSS